MRFISVSVRNALVMHGYDADNVEVIETVEGESFAEKLIAVDRIQSVSEKYILVSSSHGRVMYWEYEDGFAKVVERLSRAGLVVS
jgi:tricorn protease-like protein